MRACRDRVTLAVCVVVAAAVLVRVVGLGTRPFHWDEARTGYWALRTLETGTFEYRPVAGGPLVSHLSRWSIAAIGASDPVARLPFAVLTGFLPAVALSFRGRLRDDETVALAILLGFAPLLVYYGRFLRGDLLAAGAALAAVGFACRWVDTDRDRWVYAGAVAVVVALASSSFAVATTVVVLAAGVATVDHRRVAGAGGSVPAALGVGSRWLLARATPLARALFLFLGIWGVLFAPRGGDPIGDPLGFISATYREPVRSFLAVRVGGREGTEFLPFLTDGVGTLLATSAVVLALGIVGFLADRYHALPEIPSPRPTVAFAGLWAGFGLVAYPVVAETIAPWTTLHALVPMAVPAAVALAATYRYGRRALERGDAARATAALLVLAAVASGVGVGFVDGVYGPNGPTNEYAQFGQPSSDLEPLVADVDAAVAEGDDRLVYVGDRFAIADESTLIAPPIASTDARSAFGERLPLPWYVGRTEATVESVRTPADIDGDPAVLVVDPEYEAAVADRFPDHDAETVELALWNREAVVFIDRE